MTYKYLNANTVAKIDVDGKCRMSCNLEHPDYLAWLAEGNTTLPTDPPTVDELAAEAQRVADAEAKAEAKFDTVVKYLRDHTPTECVQYVESNVDDLASAKALMKKFAIVLCVLKLLAVLDSPLTWLEVH